MRVAAVFLAALVAPLPLLGKYLVDQRAYRHGFPILFSLKKTP